MSCVLLLKASLVRTVIDRISTVCSEGHIILISHVISISVMSMMSSVVSGLHVYCGLY